MKMLLGGFFFYLIQVMIQFVVQYECIVVVIFFYFVFYFVGLVFGNIIVVVIWINIMFSYLYNDFICVGFFIIDVFIFQVFVYVSFFQFIIDYLFGMFEREVVGSVYREVQRYLMIIGICILIVIVFMVFSLRNLRFGDEQSLLDVEKFEKVFSEMLGIIEEIMEIK